jgi:hypothetical protein
MTFHEWRTGSHFDDKRARQSHFMAFYYIKILPTGRLLVLVLRMYSPSFFPTATQSPP